jgi:hypothetical protein
LLRIVPRAAGAPRPDVANYSGDCAGILH